MATSFSQQWDAFYDFCSRTNAARVNLINESINGFLSNKATYRSYSSYDQNYALAQNRVEWRKRFLLDPTAMNIGAVPVSVPITDINFATTKEVSLVNTMRTPLNSAVRKASEKSTFIIRMVFTNQDDINNVFRHIIAQQTVSPILPIRSKHLTSMALPYNANNAMYYEKYLGLIKRINTRVPTDEELNTIYTEVAPLYSIDHIDVQPIPDQVDAIQMNMIVTLVDDTMFGKTDGVRFLRDDVAVIDQLTWVRNKYIWVRENRDKLNKLMDYGIINTNPTTLTRLATNIGAGKKLSVKRVGNQTSPGIENQDFKNQSTDEQPAANVPWEKATPRVFLQNDFVYIAVPMDKSIKCFGARLNGQNENIGQVDFSYTYGKDVTNWYIIGAHIGDNPLSFLRNNVNFADNLRISPGWWNMVAVYDKLLGTTFVGPSEYDKATGLYQANDKHCEINQVGGGIWLTNPKRQITSRYQLNNIIAPYMATASQLHSKVFYPRAIGDTNTYQGYLSYYKHSPVPAAKIDTISMYCPVYHEKPNNQQPDDNSHVVIFKNTGYTTWFYHKFWDHIGNNIGVATLNDGSYLAATKWFAVCDNISVDENAQNWSHSPVHTYIKSTLLSGTIEILTCLDPSITLSKISEYSDSLVNILEITDKYKSFAVTDNMWVIPHYQFHINDINIDYDALEQGYKIYAPTPEYQLKFQEFLQIMNEPANSLVKSKLTKMLKSYTIGKKFLENHFGNDLVAINQMTTSWFHNEYDSYNWYFAYVILSMIKVIHYNNTYENIAIKLRPHNVFKSGSHGGKTKNSIVPEIHSAAGLVISYDANILANVCKTFIEKCYQPSLYDDTSKNKTPTNASQQFIDDVSNFYKSKSVDKYITNLKLEHGFVTPTAIATSSIDREDVIQNPIGKNSASYVAYTTKHIEESLPFIKYYRSVLRESNDKTRNANAKYAYKINENYPSVLEEYSPDPASRAIRLYYKTVNPDLQNILFLTNDPVSDPELVQNTLKISSNDLIGIRSKLRGLPNNRESAVYTFTVLIMSQLVKEVMDAHDVATKTKASPVIQKLASLIDIPILKDNPLTTLDSDVANEVAGKKAKDQREIIDYRRLSTISSYLINMVFSKKPPLHMIAELVDNIISASNRSTNTISAIQTFNSVVDAITHGVNESTAFVAKAQLITAISNILGNSFNEELEAFVLNIGKRDQKYVDPIISLLNEINSDVSTLMNKVNQYLKLKKDNLPVDTATKFDNLTQAFMKIKAESSKKIFIKPSQVNTIITSIKSKVSNYNNFEMSKILGVGCNAYDSLVGMLGIQAKDSLLSSDSFDTITRYIITVTEYLAAVQSLMTNSPFKWAELAISDEPLSRADLTSAMKTNSVLKQTTITDYRITKENDNVHIYRDGNLRPSVQNFGGGNVGISLTFMTCDNELLLALVEAAIAMDIPLRQATMMEYRTPFIGNAENRAAYSKLMSITTNYFQQISGTSPTSQAAFDIPLIIQNNIANMMGIKHCVVSSMSFNTVPNNPNYMSVMIEMLGTNTGLKDFETPTYEQPKFDTTPFYSLFSSMANMDLGQSEYSSYVDIMKSVNERMIKGLVLLETVNVLATSVYAFCMAKRQNNDLTNIFDVTKNTVFDNNRYIPSDNSDKKPLYVGRILFDAIGLVSQAKSNINYMLSTILKLSRSDASDKLFSFIKNTKESFKFLLGTATPTVMDYKTLIAEYKEKSRETRIKPLQMLLNNMQLYDAVGDYLSLYQLVFDYITTFKVTSYISNRGYNANNHEQISSSDILNLTKLAELDDVLRSRVIDSKVPDKNTISAFKDIFGKLKNDLYKEINDKIKAYQASENPFEEDSSNWEDMLSQILTKQKVGFLSLVTTLKRDPYNFSVSFANNGIEITRTDKAETGFFSRLENVFSNVPSTCETAGVAFDDKDEASKALSADLKSMFDTNDFMIFNIFEDLQKTVAIFADRIIGIVAAFNTINQVSVLSKESEYKPATNSESNNIIWADDNILESNKYAFLKANKYYEGLVVGNIPKSSSVQDMNYATINDILQMFQNKTELKKILIDTNAKINQVMSNAIVTECNEISEISKHVYNICPNASLGILTKSWNDIENANNITVKNLYLLFPGEVLRRVINVIDVTNGMTFDSYNSTYGKDFERVKKTFKNNYAILDDSKKKSNNYDDKIIRLINYAVMYSASLYNPYTKENDQPRYDNVQLNDVKRLITAAHEIVNRIIKQQRSDVLDFEYLANEVEHHKTQASLYDIPQSFLGVNFSEAIDVITTELKKANNMSTTDADLKQKAATRIIDTVRSTVVDIQNKNAVANRLTREWRDDILNKHLDLLHTETKSLNSQNAFMLTCLMILFKSKKQYTIGRIYPNDSLSWYGTRGGDTADIDKDLNNLFVNFITSNKVVDSSLSKSIWIPNAIVSSDNQQLLTKITYRMLLTGDKNIGEALLAAVDVVLTAVDLVLIVFSFGTWSGVAAARMTAFRGARLVISAVRKSGTKLIARNAARTAARTAGRHIAIRAASSASRLAINLGIQATTRAIDVALLLNSDGDIKSIFTTMAGMGATRAVRRGVAALTSGLRSGVSIAARTTYRGFIGGARLGLVAGNTVAVASAVSPTVQSSLTKARSMYLETLKQLPVLNIVSKLFPYTPLSIDSILNSAPFTFSLYYKENTIDQYIESQFIPAIANGAFPAPADILGHILVEMNGWDETLNRFFDMKTAYKDLPVPVFTELTEAESQANYLTSMKKKISKYYETTNNQTITKDSESFLLKQIYAFTDPAFYLYKASPISEAERRDIHQKQRDSNTNILRSSDDKSQIMQQVIADSISKLELEMLGYQQEVRSFAIRLQNELGDDKYYGGVCESFGVTVPLYDTIKPKTLQKSDITNSTSSDDRDKLINELAQQRAMALNGEIKVSAEKMAEIGRATMAVQGTSGGSLYSEFRSLNDKRVEINTKTRTLRSIYNALNNGMSDKKAYDIMMQIMKPSEGIASDHTMELSEYYFDEAIRTSARRDVSGNPVCGYPSFKIYFIEEDNKRLRMFNDFFSYAAVQSIDVFKSKLHAADTAVIRVTNTYGNLTNMMAAGLSNENPFLGAVEENKNVSAIMLKPGCMVQIRMGYKAILNEDEIVFTGEIADIQGDEILTITCQGHGAPLTQMIGTGEGITAGGTLEAINYGLNRVRTILFQIIDAVDGMDRLGGKTIRGNISEIYHDDVMPLINTIGYNILHSGLKSVIGEDNYKNIVGDVIDTKWRNILLHEESGFGQSLITKWLIYNETAWDSLQDLCLQFPNTICTVRPYDDEATLIIADRDDYYQFTDVTLGSNKYLFDSIKKLRKVTENKEKSIAFIQNAFINLSGNKDSIIQNRGLVALYITGVMQLMRTFGTFGETQNIDSIRQQIEAVYNTVDGQINAGDANSLITITEKKIQETYDRLSESNKDADDDSDDAMFDAAIQSIIENALTAKTRVNDINRALLMRQQGIKPDNETAKTIASQNSDEINKAADSSNKYDIYTKIGEQLLIDTQQHVNGSIAYVVCKILLKKVLAASSQHRAISESHYKSSDSTIIKNDIMLQDGYNKVKMTYMDKNMAASVIDSLTSGLLNIASMNIRNIDNPSAHREINIVASPSLRPSGVNTYTTFQKNASALEELMTERKYAVGNQILANLMRDYYGGSLTVMGDPYIQPYDRVFVDDKKRDMWGFVGVKEVHHMFSKESGFVTVISPEMEITTRFNPEQGFSAGAELAMFALKGLDVGLKVYGLALMTKFITNTFNLNKLTDAIRKPIMDIVEKTASKAAAEKLATAPLTTLINQGFSYKSMGGGMLGFGVATAKWMGLYKLAQAFPTPVSDLNLRLGDFMNIQPINAMPLMYKGQLFISNMDGVTRKDRSLTGMGAFMQSLTTGFSNLVMDIEHVPQSILSTMNHTLDNISNPTLGVGGSRIKLN